MKPWQKTLILIGGSLAVLLVIMGLAVEANYLPGTKVLAGKEIQPWVREVVARRIDLEPEEKIQFYYCAHPFSHDADGNVITDRRVITYERPGEKEMDVMAASWQEIREVKMDEQGTWFTDSLVAITTDRDACFWLLLSTEKGRDRKALRYMQDMVRREGRAGR